MSPVRVYADTSVFGGVHDQEFATASRALFEQVREGTFQLIISTTVEDELAGAPEDVRNIFDEVIPVAEVQAVTEGALALQQSYLNAGILDPKWDLDALHVALATVSHCTMIVSWNFRHIVNYKLIPRYNAVNALEGYEAISIYSPLEVAADER